MAAVWRCPGARHAMAPDAAALPPDAREAHRAACELIGAPLPPTCPRYALTLPAVGRAVRAYAWREKGALASIEPDVPGPLADAIDAVGAGVAAAQQRSTDDARKAHP